MRISRSTLIWYIVPILLFFIIAFAFFSQPIDLSQTKLETEEDPLTPNVQLQLLPGEVYRYEYNLSGELSNVTYSVMGLSNDCMNVHADASNSELQAETDLCVYVSTGQVKNSSLSLDISQPWMLALEEGFVWNSETRIIYPDPVELEDITRLTIQFLGVETYRGREAFKVRASTERIITGSAPATIEHILWVDKQKRVLLGSEAAVFKIRLLSAPFEFD
ncbi:hypothetical protein DRN67_01220 [Candidatus Micrarchaeota archaeon]|nr:MAG: hypothetical protein DRN67_01220 [Candidatus Micrarchaeota archaeon]